MESSGGDGGSGGEQWRGTPYLSSSHGRRLRLHVNAPATCFRAQVRSPTSRAQRRQPTRGLEIIIKIKPIEFPYACNCTAALDMLDSDSLTA